MKYNNNSDFVRTCLSGLGKETRYMSNNEAVAYWHSQISMSKTGQITFQYDPHYCQYFANHSSEWTLHIADWLYERLERKRVSQQNTVVIDKLAKVNTVVLNPGVGKRVLTVR